MVVTGSSNALLMWNTLLMMLAPSEAKAKAVKKLRQINNYASTVVLENQAGEQRTGRFGGAHLLDAVIEDGVIIHYETATQLNLENRARKPSRFGDDLQPSQLLRCALGWIPVSKVQPMVLWTKMLAGSWDPHIATYCNHCSTVTQRC